MTTWFVTRSSSKAWCSCTPSSIATIPSPLTKFDSTFNNRNVLLSLRASPIFWIEQEEIF